MEYRIKVRANGRSAQNKGLIVGRFSPTEREGDGATHIWLEAHDHAEAFELASKLFKPEDKRPLAGKSYLPAAALKPRKLGQKVKLLRPYHVIPGYFEGYRDGVVSEVLNRNMVSVEFPGYYTRFVDFHISELA